MLFEVVFLVLMAVVLTIIGVGMVEVHEVRGLIKKEHVSGRLVRAQGKDAIYIDAGLSPGQKKFVKYHEEFHLNADNSGYHTAAAKERYADHAAIYRLLLEGDEKTAWEGIKYLQKTGRIENLGTQETIGDIVQYLATGKMSGRVKSGMMRTKKLILESSGYPSQYIVQSEYTMQAFPKDMKEAAKSISKGIWSYVDWLKELYGESRKLDKKPEDVKAISGKVDKFFWDKAKKYTGGAK